MAKHLIIDGNNLLFRCYWSAYHRWHETRPNMYGYFMLNVLKSYVKLFNPSDIILTWDERKGEDKNDRKDISEDYKANREYNADVFEFVDDIREILDALGVRQMYPLNREGDDIMYWLCAIKYPNESILVSNDTDMYQLVREDLRGNVIYNPAKKIQVGSSFLKLNYDVDDGREFIIKKALRGDKADNISGIKGIRNSKIKNIISILSESSDVESLKASGILNEEEYETFVRNKSLMMLDEIAEHQEETAFYEEQMKSELKPNKERFRAAVKRMEYWNIYKNIDRWYKLFQCESAGGSGNYYSFF